MTSPEEILRKVFTDRDRGKWFVLSAFRTASGAAKSEHIIPNCIHATRNGCMEGKLFCMCQNITHVVQKVNGTQMYTFNLFI